MSELTAPSAPPLAASAPDPVVVVAFAGPEPQRRATVAFRLVLAIPHVLYALLLGIAGLGAIVAGWFAALVTGRLPAGVATFLGGIVRYSARLTSYLFLLTDRYPPFDLQEAGGALDVRFPAGIRLNRAAVLFRLVIAVPALMVLQFVSSGAWVLAFFAWLILLITARLPASLFGALAAIVRYEVRAYAFVGMLTSEYPRRLFGDGAPPPEAAPGGGAETWPMADLAAAEGLAGAAVGRLDVGAPEAPGAGDEAATGRVASTIGDEGPVVPAPPAAGSPLVDAAPPGTVAGRPTITRLVLSRSAKGLVVVALVTGAILQSISWVGAFGSDVETFNALADAYDELGEASLDYGAEAQRCAFRSDLDCLADANREVAEAFRDFQSELRRLELPGFAVAAAERVDEDATDAIRLLELMAAAEDADEYDVLVSRFQTVALDFDQHFVELMNTFGY